MKGNYFAAKVWRKIKADGPLTCSELTVFFGRCSRDRMQHILIDLRRAGKLRTLGRASKSRWEVVSGASEPEDRRGRTAGSLAVLAACNEASRRAAEARRSVRRGLRWQPTSLEACMGLPLPIATVIAGQGNVRRVNSDPLTPLAYRKRKAA